MRILVFNCGSSSLKYRLMEMPGEKEITGGEAQRIGPPTAEASRIVWKNQSSTSVRSVPMRNHAGALEEVMRLLVETGNDEPDAAGHRLVHGGTLITSDTLVDDQVAADLQATTHLAPLHNPPAVETVMACRARFPGIPQAVVSDTAFHSSIPDRASAYAVPGDIRRRLGIRKYGFHGISHGYIAAEAAKLIGVRLERFSGVSCHIGTGGASLCAVIDGKSVDNTMGYSPLQGLVMSTRCGDLDPGAILHLLSAAGGNAEHVEQQLNRQSGVLGLSGCSADVRDALKASAGGRRSDRACLTTDIYTWRLRKYLGAYLMICQKPQAVIFTDSVGEEVPEVRYAACVNMEVFGLMIDRVRNFSPGPLPADIALPSSPVRILVIHANEELAIARSTYSLLAQRSACTF